MQSGSCAPHDAQVERCRSGFAENFGTQPAAIALAPGRINVIGEHTDYSDGLALPGAIDRWTAVALRSRHDDCCTVVSQAFSPAAAWRAGEPWSEMLPPWSRLMLGLADVFAAITGVTRGFDAYISSSVPVGAGVSSSAAAEVSMLLALSSVFDAELEGLDLVRAAQRAERRALGVSTGLMDPYTSVFGRPGALLLIDFAGPHHDYIAADVEGYRWVLTDTRTARDLAASGYNERVEETRRALNCVAAVDDNVTSFRDLTAAHLDTIEDRVLRRRLRHYISENERVLTVAAALVADDVEHVGAMLSRSHASLRDDYEVSRAELDHVADTAAGTEGCLGARMMGGGFGGCVLSLVAEDAVEAFIATTSREFEARFGYAPAADVYALVGGARVD